MLDPDSDWLAPHALEVARALPASCYVDAAFSAIDRDAVFAHSWQHVAHAERVAHLGDHVQAQIGAVPLLIIRGDDCHLRALHNVCRHRAGPLATCDGRGATALVCKYHGWTYALDGQLRGAPEMGRATGFDPATVRLPTARVAQWQGHIFAALEGEAPEFEDVVAGIDARLCSRPLDRYAFDRRVGYEVACNWKVYVDNYLEGYHVRHVHPRLASQLDTAQYATQTARWHSLQSSPLVGDALYGTGEALYYFIYPNTMLNILPGRMQTNRVVPLGPDRCRVDFDYFYADEVPIARRLEDQCFSDEVQREDIAICESVQRGLASGSYTSGRLNPASESGVHHFQELVRAAYRAHARR
jgi:choline monooxygenase